MKRIAFVSMLLLSLTTLISNCKGSKELGSGINLFTIEQDRELGAQVAAEIDGNPQEYPLLDST